MDLVTQAQIVLRDAGYETRACPSASHPVICFENPTLIGFVHEFESAELLLARWEESQKLVLQQHEFALRTAGSKAWNVYSVFLTQEQATSRQWAIERLEEDFTLTRKIARAAVRTREDVERVLLPLTAIRAQPLLEKTDFEARLRLRLDDISTDAVKAFLSKASTDDVVQILRSKR